MLEAAVARSHPGEESGQQAERSGLLPRSLHFPRDPVLAAKKVRCLTASGTSYPTAPPLAGGIRMRMFPLCNVAAVCTRLPASYIVLMRALSCIQYQRSELQLRTCNPSCRLGLPQPAPGYDTGGPACLLILP